MTGEIVLPASLPATCFAFFSLLCVRFQYQSFSPYPQKSIRLIHPPPQRCLHQASSLCGEWIAGRAVWQRRWRLKRSGEAEGKELLLGAPWVTLCQAKELDKSAEEEQEPSRTLVPENWILITILVVRLCPFLSFGN